MYATTEKDQKLTSSTLVLTLYCCMCIEFTFSLPISKVPKDKIKVMHSIARNTLSEPIKENL